MGDCAFFRAGGGEVILRCYELAKFYGTDPDVFLKKPVSHVLRAVDHTADLIERTRKAGED